MDYKQLEKAYEAIEMLNSLSLPVSTEQLNNLAKMEHEYLSKDVIPHLKDELQPLIEKIHTNFKLEVTYSIEAGLNFNLIDRVSKQASFVQKERGEESKRQKKYIIRVVFPNKQVSCSKKVWETLLDVIRYASPEKVQQIGIKIMGRNLVSKEPLLDDRFRERYKEIKPGWHAFTLSSTDKKFEQIKKINSSLKLGLKIEKVMR